VSIINIDAAQLELINAINRSLPRLYDLHVTNNDGQLMVYVYGYNDPFLGRPLLAEVYFDAEKQFLIIEFRKASRVQKDIIRDGISQAVKYPVYQI
jgi:hypothetical protein